MAVILAASECHGLPQLSHFPILHRRKPFKPLYPPLYESSSLIFLTPFKLSAPQNVGMAPPNRALVLPAFKCHCYRHSAPTELCRAPGDTNSTLPFNCTLEQVGAGLDWFDGGGERGLEGGDFREVSTAHWCRWMSTAHRPSTAPWSRWVLGWMACTVVTPYRCRPPPHRLQTKRPPTSSAQLATRIGPAKQHGGGVQAARDLAEGRPGASMQDDYPDIPRNAWAGVQAACAECASFGKGSLVLQCMNIEHTDVCVDTR